MRTNPSTLPAFAFAFALASLFSASACAKGPAAPPLPAMTEEEKAYLSTATFGAGCFWCVEAVFERIDGVRAVESGYTGGHVEDPTYRQVCEGTTGHAEVARVWFDPAVVDFETLLDLFWRSHDPTTLNRQGADTGTQYRSAIFFHDEAQKEAAKKSKKEAQALFDDPIVTEITPAGTYYPAENYHQDYFRLNRNAPYCQFVIAPKLRKLGLE